MRCVELRRATTISNILRLLHANGIPACSNIMLTADTRACVADLGTALHLNRDETASVVGFSNTHAAPELLLGGRCSPAADVYSLGILLIEIVTLAPVLRRSSWRLPSAPHECPQVGEGGRSLLECSGCLQMPPCAVAAEAHASR